MSLMCENGSGGCHRHSGDRDSDFLRHIDRFVGETVTIFTTSGGASGCGFTGVVLSVNRCFIRLVTDFGTAPGNPISESICRDMDNDMGSDDIRCCSGSDTGRRNSNRHNHSRAVGSVVDIPVDRIAAFCHNAI